MSGPAPEGHGADAAHVRRAFGGAHAGVEDLHAGGAAVVVHEDDEGVLGDAERFDLGHEPTDVLVDVVDHAEEVLGVLTEPLSFVQRGVFRSGVVRPVRSVRRDVSVERTLGGGLAFDPLGRLLEEFVGAVALGLHELAVVQQGRAIIGILRDIAAAARVALADAAGAMDVHLVETALVRLVFGFVAEVPLAEDTCPVTGLLQLLGKRHRSEGHALAFEDRVRDAVLELVTAGQQGAARRRARRRDLEVGEPDALGAELIEVRRLEDRIPVGAQVAIALVVGQDEDDVRTIRRHDGQGDAEREET